MIDLPAEAARERTGFPHWPLLAALLLIGCALRIIPWNGNQGMAYDESYYRKYLLMLDQHGVTAYPDVCAAFLEDGKDEKSIAKVPPLRILFIGAGLIWKRLAFGDAPPAVLTAPNGIASDPALRALRGTATLFGCLALWPGWALARRFFRDREALAILALFACSPLAIHTSQHGLVDGIYGSCALFTLWTLVESLREKAHPGWLIAFGVSFACLVLAKENALFVGIATAVILLFGRFLGLSRGGFRHWSAAVLGGLAALTILCWAAGGFRTMLDVYLLFIVKVQNLPYAHETGRGPWYRYFVEFMLLTPVTFCFALGGIFLNLCGDRRTRVFLVFIVVTFVLMCNVRNGMNLRYTTIWEFPLCALAGAQLGVLADRFRRPVVALTVLAALLCAIDLRQYHRFFVAHSLIELAPEYLLRASEIIP
ncbi:dolichyl-phosphate-mannose-protein mannosyltransferase [Chthoniobacter flavus]|uniref:ArnT family glycosyltransferase n=1 Tax=Chthoniobacter flavus TaxID=191863 RepID=UPI00104524B1|nr:glycosyltransferase family 39 protein [Chthoniobacter flavus]TCO91783.1 dolichyl-phosphate-mannose-protein mannosyltransferase [Chthoniobacter flavus]